MITGPPKPSLDHRHVPEQQRPHDAFPELGLGDEQRAKLVGGTTIASTSSTAWTSIALGFSVSVPRSATSSPGRTSISSWVPPISCANSATGSARPSGSRLTTAIRPERITYIPGLGLSHPAEELARPEPTYVAEAADPIDLGRGQDREHLVEPSRERALWRGTLRITGHVGPRMANGTIA